MRAIIPVLIDGTAISGCRSAWRLPLARPFLAYVCSLSYERYRANAWEGCGFVEDFPVQEYYREAKLCTIGNGTTEIQRLVRARLIVE